MYFVHVIIIMIVAQGFLTALPADLDYYIRGGGGVYILALEHYKKMKFSIGLKLYLTLISKM